jgi:hypothetical protein
VIPSKPFALVFDFSALLEDNLNWNSYTVVVWLLFRLAYEKSAFLCCNESRCWLGLESKFATRFDSNTKMTRVSSQQLQMTWLGVTESGTRLADFCCKWLESEIKSNSRCR